MFYYIKLDKYKIFKTVKIKIFEGKNRKYKVLKTIFYISKKIKPLRIEI